MARTKIVIEIETEDEHFVRCSGQVIVEYTRNLVKAFSAYKKSSKPKVLITHDGKDVTEVIQ